MDKKAKFLTEEKELSGVAMNATDILQQKFTVKFRGYDVQDVDSFLEIIAREMEGLSNDNMRMSDEITNLRKDVDAYRKKEESINAALVTVQRMADDVKRNASIEAERKIVDADNKAGEIIKKSKEKSDEVIRDINILKDRAEIDTRAIIDNARVEAGKEKEKLLGECAKAHEDLNMLKKRKIQFVASMKTLIETHLKLMESESE
jgi:cell division initiation protein